MVIDSKWRHSTGRCWQTGTTREQTMLLLVVYVNVQVLLSLYGSTQAVVFILISKRSSRRVSIILASLLLVFLDKFIYEYGLLLFWFTDANLVSSFLLCECAGYPTSSLYINK